MIGACIIEGGGARVSLDHWKEGYKRRGSSQPRSLEGGV